MQQQGQQAQQAVQDAQAKLEQEKMDKVMEARKLGIDEYNAETNRLKVTSGGMNPEQVQAVVFQTLQDLMTNQAVPQVQPAPLPQINEQMQ